MKNQQQSIEVLSVCYILVYTVNFTYRSTYYGKVVTVYEIVVLC